MKTSGQLSKGSHILVKEQLVELIQISENLTSYELRQSVRRLVNRLTLNEPGSLGDWLRCFETSQIGPIALLNGLAESLSQTEDQVTGWIAACELLFQSLTCLHRADSEALSARASSFLVMSGLQAIEACTLSNRLKYQLTTHYGCMATELLGYDAHHASTQALLLAYGAEGISYIEYEAGTWAELYHDLFMLLGTALATADYYQSPAERKQLLAQMNALVYDRQLEGLSHWYSIIRPVLLETCNSLHPVLPDCTI